MKELDQFFKGRKEHVTMGVEVEMYLYDAENECLIGTEHQKIVNECFTKLPNTVTKDYYIYQLEVRTKPHNSPEGLIKEFEETLKKCRDVFAKHKIEIKPLSWLGGQENYNGVHFHFRNGNRNNFQNTMFNMYPFVLSLTDCFKNSVNSENDISRRFANSHHIGFPALSNLAKKLVDESRYKDIIVNGFTDNNRHRLKSEATVEVRTFDVPYNFEYFKNLVHLMFNLYANINSEKEIKLYSDAEIKDLLIKTRSDITLQRIGHNFLFDLSNKEIYKYLCDKFKIKQLCVPVVLDKENKIKNRGDLSKFWRQLGTKFWFGERKIDFSKIESSPMIAQQSSPEERQQSREYSPEDYLNPEEN